MLGVMGRMEDWELEMRICGNVLELPLDIIVTDFSPTTSFTLLAGAIQARLKKPVTLP